MFVPFILAAFYATRIRSRSVTMRIRIQLNNANPTGYGSTTYTEKYLCYLLCRDDPSTELLSTFTSVWPTGLATNQSIQDKLVQELLQAVLSAFLRRFPKDANVLQTWADLQYANSNYRSALAAYVEVVAVKTDFFELPIDQGVVGEGYVNRMVRCCSEMGRLTQVKFLNLQPLQCH